MSCAMVRRMLEDFMLCVKLTTKKVEGIQHFCVNVMVIKDVLRGEPCKDETLLYQMGVGFKR